MYVCAGSQSFIRTNNENQRVDSSDKIWTELKHWTLSHTEYFNCDYWDN